MMQGVDIYIGPQIQTLVVLLGVFIGVVLWGFFQHRHSE
jgi:cbb3-type cytochrome oxidase subunit 3